MQEKSRRTYGNFNSDESNKGVHEKIMGKFDRDEIIKFFKEFEQKRELEKELILKKFFPDHFNHHQLEEDAEWFDALFISRTYSCDCGERLVFDRDHYEDKEICEKLKKKEL